jgi:kanamycin nucleotidyltransferase
MKVEKTPNAPCAHTHEERIKRALKIEARLKSHYGDQLVALGIYGSVARGTDGPFSDLEMLCIVQGKSLETSYEWCDEVEGWKAELNVYSPDTFLGYAESLENDWPVTHGALTAVMPLVDPTHFFWGLQTVVFGHPQEAFDERIRALIVEDIYELAGKIRNAQNSGCFDNLLLYVVFQARYASCLVGLANRAVFSSASQMFREALQMPDRPKGFDDLCRLVMSGNAGDTQKICAAAESFWTGVRSWAAARKIKIGSDLAELLHY